MALKKEIGEVEIRLNADQANAKIKELQKETQKLEKAIDDLGTGDEAKRRELYETLQKNEAQILKLRESVKTDMRVIINGEVAGKTVRDLDAAVKVLRREFRALGDDDPELAKKAAQIALIEQQANKLKEPLKAAKQNLIEFANVGSIDSLTAKIERLKKEYNALGAAGGPGLEAAGKEIAALERELDALKAPLEEARKSLANLAPAGSLDRMNADLKQLVDEYNQLGDAGQAELKEKALAIATLQTKIEALNAPLKEARAQLANLGAVGSINELQGRIELLKQEYNALAAAGGDGLEKKAVEIATLEKELKQLQLPLENARKALANLAPAGSLDAMNADLKILIAEYNQLGGAGNDQIKEKAAQIAALQNKIELLNAPLREAKAQFENFGDNGSLASLNNKVSQLRSEINLLTPGTEAFVNKTKELQRVESDVKKLNNTISGQTGLWNSLSTSVKQFGVLAAGYLGVQALTSQISNIISKNGQLSDSLADVRQTTGFTQEEVEKLNSSFKKLDTRTATQDLRDIAKVGGQFGVAKDQILGFTEAINKATVVLKSEFKGGAEEITTTLSGLRNVLTDTKTGDIAKDLTQLGNGLIVLAQQGNATAPVMADFSNRIGGLGIPLGLTSGQVLGLSATMQELNINAERGGTAIGKILQKMTTNTEEFAKIAGVPLKEFQNLITTDLMGAFTLFLEGTKKFKGNAIEMGGALKELETSGASVSETIAKLGPATLLLSQKVATASDAIKSTTAITDQYNLKNENLAGQIDRLSKKFYEFATNRTLNQWLASAVSGTLGFITQLSRLPDWINRNSQTLLALAGATAVFYAETIKSTYAVIASRTAIAARSAVVTLAGAGLVALGVITGTLSTLTGVLTGRITFAAAAQAAWNLIMRLNPLGLLISGLTAFVLAINSYASSTKQAIALENEKLKLTRDLTRAQILLSREVTKYNTEIEKLNRLSPEQQRNLKAEIDLKVAAAKATYAQLLAEQQRVRNASSQVTTWQTFANSIKAVFTDDTFADLMHADALEAGREAAAKYGDELDNTSNLIKGLEGAQENLTNKLGAFDQAMAINAKTVEQYEEKISLLKTALNGATIGSEKFKQIQLEINNSENSVKTAKSESSISVSNNSSSTNTTVDNKITKVELQSSEAEQKLLAFKEKIQKLSADIGKTQTDILTDAAAKESAALSNSYADTVNKTKQNAAELENEQKQLLIKKEINRQQFDERMVVLHNSTNSLLHELDNKFEIDRLNLALKYREQLSNDELVQDNANLTERFNQEKLLLTQNFAAGIIDQQEYNRRIEALELDTFEARLRYANEYWENSKKNLEQNFADEKAKLDKQLADKTLSEADYNTELTSLEDATAEQKTEIAKRYGKTVLELEQAIAEGRIQIKDAEVSEYLSKEAEKTRIELELAEEGSQKQLDLIVQGIEKERDEKIKQHAGDAEMRALYENEANQKIENARRAHNQKLLGLAQQAANQLTGIYTNYLRILDNKNQVELQKEKKSNDKKRDEYKKQLDSKAISQEEYNVRIEKLDSDLDKKQAELKRKAFIRQRRFSIIQALINTALGVTQALSSSPPPASYILAAITAAAGAIEVAAIASQPVPEFKYGKPAGQQIEKGKGGIVSGPSHADGGLDIINPKTNERVGNMEGREMIVSEKAVADNPEISNLLIERSLAGGGKIDAEELKKLVILDSVEKIYADAKEPRKFERGKTVGPIPATEDGKASVNLVDNERTGKASVNIDDSTERTGKASVNIDDNTTNRMGKASVNVDAVVNLDPKIKVDVHVDPPKTEDGKASVNRAEEVRTVAPVVVGPPKTDDGKASVNLVENERVVQPVVVGPPKADEGKASVNLVDNERTGKASVNVDDIVETRIRKSENVILDYADQIVAGFTKTVVNVVPKFTAQVVQQIDTKRITDNIQIERLGYSAATNTLTPEQRNNQENQFNQNQNSTKAKDEMMERMFTVFDRMEKTLQQVEEAHKKPMEVKSRVVLREISEAQDLEAAARRNAQIG